MKTRIENLMPNNEPRWIRCYDNGGITFDRFTVAFTGLRLKRVPGYPSQHPYVGMSENPFHPQGFGQHGDTENRACDVNKWGFAPMIGRKNHLGIRIPFAALPDDCRKLVIQDYKELWNLI